MEVDGLAPGRDFMLWPGGGQVWDWRLSGTHHSPGVQPSDVQHLLDQGAVFIVLSLGMERRLEVDPATIALLEKCGIPFQTAETTQAVRIYNEASESTSVGGLFHSTC